MAKRPMSVGEFTLGVMVTAREAERRRIRRAIAPALKELRELAQGGFDNIDCDRITHAIRVATRAPKKGGRRG